MFSRLTPYVVPSQGGSHRPTGQHLQRRCAQNWSECNCGFVWFSCCRLFLSFTCDLTQGYLTENGYVKLERVEMIMQAVGVAEDNIFKKRKEDEVSLNRL